MKFSRRLGRGHQPLRIGYGRIFHEANAFSPLSTTRQDFERMHSLEGAALARAASLSGAELAGYMPHAELTGFVQAARAAGGVTTIPLSSHLAVPGGPLTEECFEGLASQLLSEIEAALPMDGVYLALHGSMEVHGLKQAPEAVLLRRVRDLVGTRTKIAVSYDLHANLSPGLVDPVDVLVAYRTNPHWDLAPTGFRAGNRLIRALRGQVAPVHAWRKLPMVLGGGTTIDFLAPMRKVFRAMRRMERDAKVLSASLFMVHPYTSAPDLGWAVHVCTDGDAALAERLADQLAELAWAERDVLPPKFRSLPDALKETRRSPWRRLGPVTLVDVDDIVGAGAPGGNTHFVRELVAEGPDLSALVPVHDPGAVAAVWDRDVGEEVVVTLSGTPGYGQPSVELTATVRAKQDADFGKTVRLEIGRLQVAISERPPLPIHPKFWRELGVDPRRADVIVQKNFFHYRMFYLTISPSHLPVKSAGATSFDHVAERNYRVPTHPGTRLSSWREHDLALRGISG
ncbi:MAG: M81 family metallopeptidase [Myxococcales bacterium]|nr:M81 family metallopeptidase [Myxococcales bacterium]MCB9577904.1 M81 family metallopeptidase [Polyangiaceae bacterium]